MTALPIFSAGFLLLTSICRASVIATDTLTVSTVAGLPGGSGVTFSTSVHLAGGANWTLRGGGGYLLSESSITASAFFGDAGALTGTSEGILGATQTFTGGNTFLSSFTVQSGGREIVFSTGSESSNLLIDQAGYLSFRPELHNSSATVVPEFVTTAFPMGTCALGSTITITSSGGRIEVTFVGVVDGALEPAVSFLQDGLFVNDLTPLTAIGKAQANRKIPGGFAYLIDAPAPGIHFYCLVIGRTSNTVTAATKLYNDAFHGNLFYVKEIK